MKRTKTPTTESKQEHLDRLCEELGADTIKQLYEAFELTAGALYRRAKQRAEAEVQKADQYKDAGASCPVEGGAGKSGTPVKCDPPPTRLLTD